LFFFDVADPSSLLQGLSMVGLAFSTNYHSLLAFRFLLGLFEASCLPLFTMVTVSWYRRSEQRESLIFFYASSV